MTYLFVTLFLALISYIVYFNVFRAKTIVNSPYNVRQDAFADRIIRGSITDRDGEVLAETQVGEDGTENRVYPYGAAFAHVVGYSNETAGKSGLESIENSELLTSNAFFAEKFLNEFKDEKIMAIPSLRHWMRGFSRRHTMHWEKIGARSWLWRPAPEKFLPWCPDRPMIRIQSRRIGKP